MFIAIFYQLPNQPASRNLFLFDFISKIFFSNCLAVYFMIIYNSHQQRKNCLFFCFVLFFTRDVVKWILWYTADVIDDVRRLMAQILLSAFKHNGRHFDYFVVWFLQNIKNPSFNILFIPHYIKWKTFSVVLLLNKNVSPFLFCL